MRARPRDKIRGTAAGFLATPSNGGNRYDGRFNGKIQLHPQGVRKILFICQDEKTLDDGSFKPDASKWADLSFSPLAFSPMRSSTSS
jgi:hypothetical protein